MRPVPSASPNVTIVQAGNTAAVLAAAATLEETTAQYLAGLTAVYGMGATTLVRIDASTVFADGVSGIDTALHVKAVNQLFNGSTWDRQRGNEEFNPITSGSRTATTVSALQTNHNARGILIWIDVTVVPGVDTVQLTVEARMPSNGLFTLLFRETASAASGPRSYLIYPGGTDDAGELNGHNSIAVPQTWRIRVIHSGGGAFTYEVSVSLIL